ncbi:RluA family pseudouridine synthase [Paradevosia shaoguanensis]|uniref:RluA family pseudouridine synthase n=1 Tax=Paradevosia shaoguanensis TaxID=1335043 RepID=UPI0019327A83|nr:RluA family pseudouridine synthase [Paradevosia shaoguanensis]
MTQELPNQYIYTPPMEPYLTVIHEDEDIIVLDKPSGLLSVPGKPEELKDCLESRARERYPTASTIHRLDKDTSGVVVMALNKWAHGRIGIQFEKRQTEKFYEARLWGLLEEDRGRVDLPLATDWERKPRQRVDFENGRPSQTDWEVLSREGNITRVKLMPITGRTHQLRVHMLSLGHPIVGDPFYAPEEALAAADRLQLHAEMLGFTHPRSGARMEFVIPCPF